jgi:broad specificity phosphatase PhoE
MPRQFFAVVRHSERADGAFAFVNGQRWAHTADSKAWPVDPPLSDEGHNAVKDLAAKIQQYAAAVNTTSKTVVVTSPYCRCVQTAAPIAQALRARLLVDCQIGEVYGPQVMGIDEPTNAVKPVGSMLMDIPDFEKRLLSSKIVGTWPAWPEDLKRARQRFATRFLTYLRRSEKVHRNFVLVSHADCVGATLSLLPSHAGQIVSKIDYCGMILASRPTRAPGMFSRVSAAATSAVRWSRGSTAKTSATQSEGEEDMFNTMTIDPEEFAEPANDALQELRLVQESEGWTVELFGILCNSGEGDEKAFHRRAKSMAKKGPFSFGQIEQLLGCNLPADTLGDDNSKDALGDDNSKDALGHSSDSTLQFDVSITETSITSAAGGERKSARSTKDSMEEITKQLAKVRQRKACRITKQLADRKASGLITEETVGEGCEGDGQDQDRPASGMALTLQLPEPSKPKVVMDLGKSSMLNRRSICSL